MAMMMTYYCRNDINREMISNTMITVLLLIIMKYKNIIIEVLLTLLKAEKKYKSESMKKEMKIEASKKQWY